MSSLSASSTNPLLASTEDISKSQSIAFCAVYGVFVLILAIRLIGRVKRTFAYALVLVFAIGQSHDTWDADKQVYSSCCHCLPFAS